MGTLLSDRQPDFQNLVAAESPIASFYEYNDVASDFFACRKN